MKKSLQSIVLLLGIISFWGCKDNVEPDIQQSFTATINGRAWKADSISMDSSVAGVYILRGLSRPDPTRYQHDEGFYLILPAALKEGDVYHFPEPDIKDMRDVYYSNPSNGIEWDSRYSPNNKVSIYIDKFDGKQAEVRFEGTYYSRKNDKTIQFSNGLAKAKVVKL